MNEHDEAELLEYAQQYATALVLACRTNEDRLNALMLGVEEKIRAGDVAGVSTLVGVLAGMVAQLLREESAADEAADSRSVEKLLLVTVTVDGPQFTAMAMSLLSGVPVDVVREEMRRGG